jgi:hypothetical protein
MACPADATDHVHFHCHSNDRALDHFYFGGAAPHDPGRDPDNRLEIQAQNPDRALTSDYEWDLDLE